MIWNSHTVLDSVGFVILCPERNWGGLKVSALTARDTFPTADVVCCVPADTTDAEVEEFSTVSRVTRGGQSITALINRGVAEVAGEWAFVFMAGNPVRESVLRKYERFVRSDRDIVYPVVNRQWEFPTASINGLLLNRRTARAVGPFAEKEDDLRLVKLFWALDAIENGCQFRALVGAHL
jgi:hypothetical protein